ISRIRRIPLHVLIAAIACVLHATMASASFPMPQKAELSMNPGGPGAFGTALAIDGNTLVVGAPLASVGPPPNQGAVFIFERDTNGVWQPRGTILAGDAQDS